MELTKEIVTKVLPKDKKKLVTDNVIQFLNKAETNETVVNEFRENFLTYSKILQSSRYSLEEYVNAVRFVTYKMLGYSDIDSYAMVFPERYNRLIEKFNGETDRINAYSSRFKSTKLVTQIMEQTLVPSYIYNAPLFQEALLELSRIMVSSKSDIARVNAASNILQYTKAPEEKNINLEIGYKENDTIRELKSTMEQLATMQKKQLEKGMELESIAEADIVDVKEEK